MWKRERDNDRAYALGRGSRARRMAPAPVANFDYVNEYTDDDERRNITVVRSTSYIPSRQTAASTTWTIVEPGQPDRTYNGDTALHAYSQPGTYPVSLHVVTDAGSEDRVTKQVTAGGDTPPPDDPGSLNVPPIITSATAHAYYRFDTTPPRPDTDEPSGLVFQYQYEIKAARPLQNLDHASVTIRDPSGVVIHQETTPVPLQQRKGYTHTGTFVTPGPYESFESATYTITTVATDRNGNSAAITEQFGYDTDGKAFFFSPVIDRHTCVISAQRNGSTVASVTFNAHQQPRGLAKYTIEIYDPNLNLIKVQNSNVSVDIRQPVGTRGGPLLSWSDKVNFQILDSSTVAQRGLYTSKITATTTVIVFPSQYGLNGFTYDFKAFNIATYDYVPYSPYTPNDPTPYQNPEDFKITLDEFQYGLALTTGQRSDMKLNFRVFNALNRLRKISAVVRRNTLTNPFYTDVVWANQYAGISGDGRTDTAITEFASILKKDFQFEASYKVTIEAYDEQDRSAVLTRIVAPT